MADQVVELPDAPLRSGAAQMRRVAVLPEHQTVEFVLPVAFADHQQHEQLRLRIAVNGLEREFMTRQIKVLVLPPVVEILDDRGGGLKHRRRQQRQKGDELHQPGRPLPAQQRRRLGDALRESARREEERLDDFDDPDAGDIGPYLLRVGDVHGDQRLMADRAEAVAVMEDEVPLEAGDAPEEDDVPYARLPAAPEDGRRPREHDRDQKQRDRPAVEQNIRQQQQRPDAQLAGILRHEGPHSAILAERGEKNVKIHDIPLKFSPPVGDGNGTTKTASR